MPNSPLSQEPLLAQILQTGPNPVLCLNMADEARAAGQHVDLPQMERLLGFPVETVGTAARGVETLKQAVLRAAERPSVRHRLVLGDQLEHALSAVRAELPAHPSRAYGSDWMAARLLVGAPGPRAGRDGRGRSAVSVAERQRKRLETESGQGSQVFVTERYFGFVDGQLREVRAFTSASEARQASDRIDAVVVHPLLGLPIFGVVRYAIFWLTFTVGELGVGDRPAALRRGEPGPDPHGGGAQPRRRPPRSSQTPARAPSSAGRRACSAGPLGPSMLSAVGWRSAAPAEERPASWSSGEPLETRHVPTTSAASAAGVCPDAYASRRTSGKCRPCDRRSCSPPSSPPCWGSPAPRRAHPGRPMRASLRRRRRSAPTR